MPPLLCVLLLSGCLGDIFNPDLKAYKTALSEGEFESQVALAAKIIQQDPKSIDLSASQIKQAQTSYQRLVKSHYAFNDEQRIQDAQTVLDISPNTEIAKKARKTSHQQTKQQQLISEAVTSLYGIETEFTENFYLSPLHIKAQATSIKSPNFVDAVDEQYYLGALYKKLQDNALNDYQLQQLMFHENRALGAALAARKQLSALDESGLLTPKLTKTKNSVQQIIEVHHQTMNYLLGSLIRNGMNAAEKSFLDISAVASSRMTRGRFDKVWKEQISPLSAKQWKIFERTYLEQISTVRLAILEHKIQSKANETVLSQTYPHAKLTYKYFWPDDDLAAFRDQAPVRKREAQKITKVLDTIKFEDFSGINGSYQALVN